jgi:tetratricopeptide (TPR) repeat protein
LEQNLTICREIGHKWGIAVVLFLLAEVARSQGNGAAARARFEESRATFRELGNKGGIAACLGSLGRIAFAQGEHAAAQLLFEESLALYRELGSKSGIAGNFLDLGNVAYDRGDYTTARFVYGQSLALFRETGNYPGTNISLHKLIKVAIQQGNHAEARALSDQGAALARQNGDPGLLIMAGELARQTGECDRAAGLYQEALTLYRNQDNRPGTVMALHNLGHAELRLGQVLSARARFVEGLRLAEVGGGRRSVAQCVAGLGAAEVAGGRPERAARLLGAAGARLGGSGTDLDEVDQAEWERAEAAGVAALGREGFDAAFAEGQAMIWEQAVAFALDSA